MHAFTNPAKKSVLFKKKNPSLINLIKITPSFLRFIHLKACMGLVTRSWSRASKPELQVQLLPSIPVFGQVVAMILWYVVSGGGASAATAGSAAVTAGDEQGQLVRPPLSRRSLPGERQNRSRRGGARLVVVVDTGGTASCCGASRNSCRSAPVPSGEARAKYKEVHVSCGCIGIKFG